jgi:hypothetical protein
MQKNLYDMNKDEKQKFLTMDLAERLMRVEQNISLSFGKNIRYNQTNFYLSLTPKQKKEFEIYLNGKIKKRLFFSIFLLIPLIFIAAINITPTGNVIKNTLTESNTFILEGLALVLALLIIFFGLFSFFSKRNFDKKFKNHLKIIDKIVVRKHSIKNKKLFKSRLTR